MLRTDSALPYGSEAAIQDLETRAGQVASASTQVLDDAADREAELKAAAKAEESRIAADAAHKATQINAERDKVLGDKQAALVQMGAEIASTKIDPKRLWHEASTGQKVAGIIGIALGGLLIPTTGHNPALEMIDRALARDIQAQQANLENKRFAYGEAKGLYAMMRQSYSDRAAAVQATMAASQAQVAAQLTAKLEGVTNERTKANGLKTISDLQFKAAENMREANKRQYDADGRAFDQDMEKRKLGLDYRKEDRAERQFQDESTRGWLALTQKDEELRLNRDAKGPPGSRVGNTISGIKYKVRGPDGKMQVFDYVSVDNEKVRDELAQTLDGAEGVIDSIRDIEALGYDRAAWPSADKAVARAAMQKIILSGMNLMKGVPTDKDAQRLVDSFGGIEDPQKFWEVLSPEDRAKVMKYGEDAVRREVNTKLARRLNKSPDPNAPDYAQVEWDYRAKPVTTKPAPENAPNAADRRLALKKADITVQPREVQDYDQEGNRESFLAVDSQYLQQARELLNADSKADLVNNKRTLDSEITRLQQLVRKGGPGAGDASQTIPELQNLKRELTKKIVTEDARKKAKNDANPLIRKMMR